MNARVKKLFINLGLLSGAVAVAVLVLELAMRVLGINPAASNQVDLLTQHDSLLGWAKVPGASTVNKTTEYETVETINAQGLRGPERPFTKPDGIQRVLLLGDSYLEGYTVNDEDLVSTVLEDELGSGQVEVINGGTAGYATDQQLLFFRHHGRRYDPDIVVLMFYVNDVWFNTQDRYWRGEKPYFTQQGDSLVLHNVPVAAPAEDEFAFEVTGGSGIVGAIQRTDAWFGRNFRVYFLLRSSILQAGPVRRFLTARGVVSVPGEWLPWSTGADRELADAWEITEAIITTMRDEVEATGARFMVYYVPSRPAVDRDDWQRTRRTYGMAEAEWSPRHDATVLRSICDRNALPCVIDIEGFQARAQTERLYFAQDAHWTPAGHRLAAEQIGRYVHAQGWLAGSPPQP